MDNYPQKTEKAYIRKQVSEILSHCLDIASVSPIQNLMEVLILAESGNMEIFREILHEARMRKVQVEDDLGQVYNGLKINLMGYGVDVSRFRKPLGITEIKPRRFLGIIKSQGVIEEENQNICMQMFKDAQELLVSLGADYHLLKDIEDAIEDWMWGVIYQSVRDNSRLM